VSPWRDSNGRPDVSARRLQKGVTLLHCERIRRWQRRRNSASCIPAPASDGTRDAPTPVAQHFGRQRQHRALPASSVKRCSAPQRASRACISASQKVDLSVPATQLRRLPSVPCRLIHLESSASARCPPLSHRSSPRPPLLYRGIHRPHTASTGARAQRREAPSVRNRSRQKFSTLCSSSTSAVPPTNHRAPAVPESRWQLCVLPSLCLTASCSLPCSTSLVRLRLKWPTRPICKLP
jgi:hypothetical protein